MTEHFSSSCKVVKRGESLYEQNNLTGRPNRKTKMRFQMLPPVRADNVFIFCNEGYQQCQPHTKTEGRSVPVKEISIVFLRLVCSTKNKMKKAKRIWSVS